MNNEPKSYPVIAALCFMAILTMCWVGRPVAAETQIGFQASVDRAYPSFRMAWFYARTRNRDMANMELAEFRRAWDSISVRFRAAAPKPYIKDPRWAASLDRVGEIATEAAKRLDAGGGREVSRFLAGIRDELGALRRRNGVEVFSDLVDALGREVATLSELRRRTEGLTPEALAAYTASAARLTALMTRIRAGAPPRLASDPGFMASVEGNFKSIAKLKRGIDRAHLRAIKGSVSSVRADYVLLFIRYG